MQDLIYKMRNLKLRKNPKEENRDVLAAGVRGEYNKKRDAARQCGPGRMTGTTGGK